MGLALCFVTFTLDILLMGSPFYMLKGRGVNKTLKKYIYGIFSLGILYVTFIPSSNGVLICLLVPLLPT